MSKLACWLGVYVISSAPFNPLLASAGTRAKFLRFQSPCAAHMVDGHEYQISRTIFHWTGSKGDVYADAIGYYVPGSGEFLWWALEYNKRGYDRDLKHDPDLQCAADRHDIVELVDGELVDFYGGNSQIRVFHSKLHFPSLRRAWQYVAEHPEDTSQMLGGKWLTMISLAEIGDDFFRPERLRLDARPYFYDSLASVNKVGSNWVLEIKGADEPNRAQAVLDSDFNLLKVARH